MDKKSRRRVFKALAVTVPVAWTRPIVNSVLLPVHAAVSPEPQPELTLTCSKVVDSDSIPFNGEPDSFATIVPTPPADTRIDVDHLCDGVVIVGQSVPRFTDQDGVAQDGFGLSPALCGGATFTTRWTYMDLVSECTWQIVRG